MNKLLSANFFRLKKNKVFWICMAVTLAIGLFIGSRMNGNSAFEQVFFMYAAVIGFPFAAFCSLFIGTEYSDGTIRNKLIVGQKRVLIYISNFIVCSAAGLLLCIAYAMAVCATGMARLGSFQMSGNAILILTLDYVLMVLAFSAIFTLLGMLIQNKSAGTAIVLIGVVVLLFAATYINSRLGEPEFYDSYSYTDSTGTTTEQAEPNPNYLSAAERPVYQFFLDFLPTGQGLQIVMLSVTNPLRIPLYSLVIITLTTFFGAFFFHRRDIK